MDKRRGENSLFRHFFKDQLIHLGQLVESFQHHQLEKKQSKAHIDNMIETIVDGTDMRIRGIASYQKQLRKSARALCQHISSLVDSMPPAIEVNRTTLVTNPFLNTIFKNPESMQQLFANNKEVQTLFNSPEQQEPDEIFALLFVTRQEKNILGGEVLNDQVIKDVEQTHVSFYEHRILEPSTTEDEVRMAMKRTLLGSVIIHLKKHIVQQRHNQSEEEKLNSNRSPDKNINNPEVYIKMLADQLSIPTELLKLHDQVIRLNKMGIKLPLEACGTSELLHMQALEVGEQCCQVVCIVRFPRSELIAPTTPSFMMTS